MTRQKTYILTALSAGLFLLLNWAFADGLFSLDHLWNSDVISESTIWTYESTTISASAAGRGSRRWTSP